MAEAILALNAGSSSIKFGLFAAPLGAADPATIATGEIEAIHTAPHLMIVDAAGASLLERRWPAEPAGHDELLGALLDWVDHHLGDRTLGAVGHRIVHGGAQFVAPVVLTDDVVVELDALTPLAPLHQPLGLAPVRALGRVRPQLTQIACFDTAFHHALTPPVSRYALPRAYEARGIRRYGFHGLSYEFIARRLAEISPHLAARRTVVAHLGSGASLCAMRDGRSLDTTMGFSALDGLVMGTRSGAIDPGILLYLLQSEGMSVKAVEHLLYHQSGLLGVSGISSDMRTLLASAEPHAREAVELFVFHIARETAAMANTLGGIEALVFTGGIGEHAEEIRARVGEQLHWLGVAIDPAANSTHAARIDALESRVEVRVMATNEELTIARHVTEVLGARD